MSSHSIGKKPYTDYTWRAQNKWTSLRIAPPRHLKSLSVILPAYNEEENITTVIEDAIRSAQSVTDTYEVIVIDDGSADETAKRVKNLRKQYPGVIKLIRNNQNLGYGPTVRKGLAAGTMDWIFFTDADGQFELSEITKFIPYTDRFDFIVGRRRKRQDKFYRRLNAHIFNLAVRMFFNVKVRDIDCAFKLLKRSQLHALELVSESAMINAELLHRAKQAHMKIKELPVTHLSRQAGEATGAKPEVIKKAIREFYVLRWQLLHEQKTLLKLNTRMVALGSLLSGILITWWSYENHVILAYGDAEAHLNIAKRVISSLTPGYAQLGGIWLPLPHLLMVPFVTVNWLWTSGLGGSIPSVLAFMWLAVILYRLAYMVTNSFLASYIAPLLVIANPNSLYLASTPMTEILLLSMFTSSVYFFIKWLRTDRLVDLVLASAFTVLATLSRYDGWALVCVEFVLLAIYLAVKKKPYKVIEGMALVYGYIAFSGIALWLVWNKLIFGSFFYFSNSVYGSKEQQLFFLRSGYLPTYHNLIKSFVYFLEDIRLVVGLPILILAALGMVLFIYKCVRARRKRYLALVLLTLTPIAFYVLSLYIGQASLILPTFAKPGATYTLSNARYGIQILLAAAVFLAYLGSRAKKAIPLVLLALFLQSFYFVSTSQVITYNDGVSGLSSQKVSKGPDSPAVEAYMRSHYDNGLVLMDDYRRPIGLVESGIPMDRFIGSGNKPYWTASFDDPGKYAKWVILQKSDTDAVWKNLHRKDLLDTEFALVYSKGNLFVYEKRSAPSNFVVRSGQHLTLSGKPYVINGANSYDMLSLSDQAIGERIQDLASSHFSAVRIWCFNKQGILNDQDFDHLDTLMYDAQVHNLRIICVLGNTYEDYGGPINFGAPSAQAFFTNPNVITAYESHIKAVITHKSHIDGTSLADNPNILAWELINEPRLEGATTSGTIGQWTNTIGEYVLSLDRRHLVSPGTEGFTSSYPGQYYNEQHGASIEDICSLEVITLCSGHLYPKYISTNGIETGLDPTAIGTTLHTWRAIADRLNKPFYVGEVGFSTDGGDVSDSDRAAFFAEVNAAANSNRLDGALLWNVGLTVDQQFTLQYNDPASDEILSHWNISQ